MSQNHQQNLGSISVYIYICIYLRYKRPCELLLFSDDPTAMTSTLIRFFWKWHQLPSSALDSCSDCNWAWRAACKVSPNQMILNLDYMVGKSAFIAKAGKTLHWFWLLDAKWITITWFNIYICIQFHEEHLAFRLYSSSSWIHRVASSSSMPLLADMSLTSQVACMRKNPTYW